MRELVPDTRPMLRRRAAIFSLGTSLIVSMIVACAAAEQPVGPRLVLLYATCSLNRDFLGPYRPADASIPPVHTPNLDRFAEHSAVLRRHQTESGQSGTSFASIFTGLQAPDHQIYAHPRRLPPDLAVIGGRFQRAGYESYSWLGHVMAGAILGYARGVPEENRHGKRLLADDPEFIAILDTLAEDHSARAFIMTNFTVTHGPYRGHDLDGYYERHRNACEVRKSKEFPRLRKLYSEEHRNFSWEFEATADRLGLTPGDRELLSEIVALQYAADVEYLDELFGEVLAAIEALGLTDESVIVFTTDHGEVPVRDGLPFRWTHGMQLAPDVLTVATMISAPDAGIQPGAYENVTRSIDILPTLLSLSKIPFSALPGVNLAPALRGETTPPKLTAYSHTALVPEHFQKSIDRYPTLQGRFPDISTDHMWVGLRRGDDFFQLAPSTETRELEASLFDFKRDKGKLHDRFDAAEPTHQAAIQDLRAYRKKLADRYRSPGGPPFEPSNETTSNDPAADDISADEKERRLRALGYIE